MTTPMCQEMQFLWGCLGSASAEIVTVWFGYLNSTNITLSSDEIALIYANVHEEP